MANGYNDGFAVTGSPDQTRSQNYLTDVGAYTTSPSFYGTFDQGGNVWELNETLIRDTLRGLRGGSWGWYASDLRATQRFYANPTSQQAIRGFRVASIPEPSTVLLDLIGCIFTFTRRRKSVPHNRV